MKSSLIIAIILTGLLICPAFGQRRKTSPRPRKPVAPRPIDESALNRAVRKASAKKASELPAEYSSVYDIRNFTRFEIVADTADAKKSGGLIKQAMSAEQSVRHAREFEDGQFHIKYAEAADKTSMEVYYFNYGKRIVVWAEDRAAPNTEIELTEEFLKVLQRNKKPVRFGRTGRRGMI